MKHTVIAVLSCCLLLLAPPATAQAAPYTEAVCSDQISATGAPAVRQAAAERNAAAAWDALARNKHGSQTKFTFEAGLGMGRMKLTCSDRLGRTTCVASGRACIWQQTTKANSDVLAKCRRVMAYDGTRSICTEDIAGMGKVNFVFICPNGYSIEPNPGRQPRCLRQ